MRLPRALCRVALVAAGAGLGAVGSASSCTTFDGLMAHLDAGGGGEGGGGPPPGLLSLEDAAHVCSLVARCPALGPSVEASTGLPVVHVTQSGPGQLPAFDFRFSACLDWLAAPFSSSHPGRAALEALTGCVAASQSCTGAATCTSIEVLAPDDARCAGFGLGHCTLDRTEAIDCEALLSAHCSSPLFTPGSECFPVGLGADTRVRCGLGYCAAYAGVSCSDGYATLCTADQVRAGFACGALGLSCVEGSSGTVGCVGSDGAQACANPGEESCGGGDLVRVCGVGTYAELDCAGAGRACVAEGQTARCAPAFTTCSPYDATVDVCDGARLRTCVNGQKVLFDCASIGEVCLPAQANLSARCG